MKRRYTWYHDWGPDPRVGGEAYDESHDPYITAEFTRINTLLELFLRYNNPLFVNEYTDEWKKLLKAFVEKKDPASVVDNPAFETFEWLCAQALSLVAIRRFQNRLLTSQYEVEKVLIYLRDSNVQFNDPELDPAIEELIAQVDTIVPALWDIEHTLRLARISKNIPQKTELFQSALDKIQVILPIGLTEDTVVLLPKKHQWWATKLLYFNDVARGETEDSI